MEYKKNDIIKGFVTGIKPYGIFVGIDNKYRGLIHISEISYHFIENINEFVTIGEEIFCEILDINDENNQLTLSIKNIAYRNDGRKKNVDEFDILQRNLKNWVTSKLAEIESKSLINK